MIVLLRLYIYLGSSTQSISKIPPIENSISVSIQPSFKMRLNAWSFLAKSVRVSGNALQMMSTRPRLLNGRKQRPILLLKRPRYFRSTIASARTDGYQSYTTKLQNAIWHFLPWTMAHTFRLLRLPFCALDPLVSPAMRNQRRIQHKRVSVSMSVFRSFSKSLWARVLLVSSIQPQFQSHWNLAKS